MKHYKWLLSALIVSALFSYGVGTAHADVTPSVSIRSLSSPGGVAPGQAVTLAIDASGFVDPAYSVSDSASNSTISSSDVSNVGYFSWIPTVNDAGTHQLTFTVSDAYNDAASSTIDIQVISNAVLLQNLAPGTTVGANRTITFAVTAPGFINPLFTLSDSYPGTSAFGGDIDGSGNFSWTPTLNQLGFHMLTIYARDAYGHSGSITQSITVTNPGLSITSLKPGITAGVGTPITFSAITNGLATSTAFSVNDAFSGTSTIATSDINTNGAFSWTPATSDIGTHTLTINANDALGNAASTTQLLTIVAAPPAGTPAIASTSIATTSTATTTSATNVTAPTSNGYIFSKLLAIGASSNAVTELQNRLTALGFYSGPITGYFGTLTAAGVRRFQAAHGLSKVGYLGPLTRAALNTSE